MDDRSFDRLSKTMAGGLSRRQVLRLMGGGAAAGGLAIAGLGSVQRTAAQSTLDFPAFLEGVIDATFSATEFAIQRGQVVALGTLTGTLFDQDGTPLDIGAVPLALPLLDALSGETCEILTLVLGPLHLELLGLVVDLNQVVLTITGETGSLLGDLLCSIAGLLSGNGNALGRLRNLLNQIFGLLGL